MLRNMKVTKLILIVFILQVLQYEASGQDSGDTFTIYLVRHAEKGISVDNPKDPALTQCGRQRAESLAGFLQDVELDEVYSTEYIRTLNTAEPTANEKGLEIKIYDPSELSDFANILIDRQEDALVVGHSNTTPVLAGLLIGEEIEPINENIYNHIYQVVIYRETGRLHLLQSTFVCDN